MKKQGLSYAAAATAAAASALFYYSFTKWIPALYVLSVVLYALAAGCLFALSKSSQSLL